MASYGEILRVRRLVRGLEQKDIAEAAGVGVRTVQRWEDDERQIDFPGTATKVARKLGLTLDELAGIMPIGIELSGQWHARWQTWRYGQPVIDRHSTMIEQSGPRMSMDSDGDYNWHAEMNIVGDHANGTYRSIEVGREFGGTFHLWLNTTTDESLNAEADMMIGHWSGSFFDAPMGGGWGVVGRDADQAEQMIRHLIDHGFAPLPSWPELH
jgi:transcriptional regulator with XRE-family HTH domain